MTGVDLEDELMLDLDILDGVLLETSAERINTAIGLAMRGVLEVHLRPANVAGGGRCSRAFSVLAAGAVGHE